MLIPVVIWWCPQHSCMDRKCTVVHERPGVFWFFRLGFLEEGFLPVSYCVESLLVCSNNGGDTYTDRQTGRFHRYILASLIGAHMFVCSKNGRDTHTDRQTDRFRCYPCYFQFDIWENLSYGWITICCLAIWHQVEYCQVFT